MDSKVFDRIEKKYLIDGAQKQMLVEIIRQHLNEDYYHHSKVFNIYFDTNHYDLIIQSIDHPEFKEKLRARSYEGYDRVFLEIKTKLRGKEANVGYKRRVMITRTDFDELVAGGDIVELAARSVEKKDDVQIAHEIAYLIKHFDLKPKILVYYDRESYQGEDKLRITFDENLKYRSDDLNFNSNEDDPIYFKNEKNIIMEIKAHGVMPLWLVHALSKAKAYPTTFSKIGKVYQTIRKESNV
jgi:hypothetical protein